jgi:hypothetical protein
VWRTSDFFAADAPQVYRHLLLDPTLSTIASSIQNSFVSLAVQ